MEATKMRKLIFAGVVTTGVIGAAIIATLIIAFVNLYIPVEAAELTEQVVTETTEAKIERQLGFGGIAFLEEGELTLGQFYELGISGTPIVEGSNVLYVIAD